MTVTSQPLNYLPGLLLCSQIIPGLVKKNNNTVGGIIQGSIIFAMVRVVMRPPKRKELPTHLET